MHELLQPFAMPLRVILHPTDFSEQAHAAFLVACTLARDYAARIIVLHVAPNPVTLLSGMEVVPILPEEVDTSSLEARLKDLRAPHAAVTLETRLVQGDTGPTILRVAEEAGCDLIVMGTHGRTGLGRLLMGSVAEQIVRKAKCPVLTIKTPIPDR